MQIEDLSQQAQMQAVEQFRTPESTPAAPGDSNATVAQAIQEESEEEEVKATFKSHNLTTPNCSNVIIILQLKQKHIMFNT